jgi:hypothetical protein
MKRLVDKVFDGFSHLAQITEGKLPRNLEIESILPYEEDWKTMVIDKKGVELGQAVHIINPLCLLHPEGYYPSDVKVAEKRLMSVGCYHVLARIGKNYLNFPGKGSHLLDGKEWLLLRDAEPINYTPNGDNFPLRYLSVKPRSSAKKGIDLRCVGKMVGGEFPTIYAHIKNVDWKKIEITRLTEHPVCVIFQDEKKVPYEACVI